ncbi:MAG: carboxymuconolactone decarboxylase family protein [Desulfobacterales bacterium]|jgi:AhpD family alkylhydroperoxidase
MTDSKLRVYEKIAVKYPQVMTAVQSLGDTVRSIGPIDNKTSLLIQLAAAAAAQSEGSVHSHTRRALEAGVSAAEIEHAVMMLISVIGFPKVAAALSWVYDITEN